MKKILFLILILSIPLPVQAAWKEANLKGIYICSGSGQNSGGTQFIWSGVIGLDGRGSAELMHGYESENDKFWEGEAYGFYYISDETVGTVMFELNTIDLGIAGVLLQKGKGISIWITQEITKHYLFAAQCWKQK